MLTTSAREHFIRGIFSFFAAAAFLYVAAENAEIAVARHRYDRLFIAGAAAGFAIWEAMKAGIRIEELLRIDGSRHLGRALGG